MMRQQAGFNQLPQQIANTLKSRQQSKSMAYAIATPIFVTYLSIENNVVMYTMHMVQWVIITVSKNIRYFCGESSWPTRNFHLRKRRYAYTVTHTILAKITISHSVKRISRKFTHYNYTVVRLLLRSRDTKTCSHFFSSDGTNAKL